MSWVAVKWIPKLFDAFNARWPHRAKAQDGTIGDKAHQGETSGHNPDDTPGVSAERSDADTKPEVRSADVDARGVDMQAVVDGILADPNERKRFIYIIFNGWQYTITHLPNGSTTVSKRRYSGSDQHITHGHFSGHPDFDEDARPFTTIVTPLAGQDEPMANTWLEPLTQGTAGYAGQQRDTALAFAWQAANKAAEETGKLLAKADEDAARDAAESAAIKALTTLVQQLITGAVGPGTVNFAPIVTAVNAAADRVGTAVVSELRTQAAAAEARARAAEARANTLETQLAAAYAAAAADADTAPGSGSG